MLSFSKGKGNELESKLLKIAGSSENGSEHAASLTRTARLVLAGSNTGRSVVGGQRDSPSAKTSLFSGHVAQKYAPQVLLVTYHSLP